MGYYTNFNLEIDQGDEGVIAGRLNDIHNYGIITQSLNFHDAMKWYSHEEEMRKLSKEFPETLFTLRGSGEDDNDLWVKYFRNGKMQECRAKTVFADFDPGKLK